MVKLKLMGCMEKVLADFRRILMWAAIFTQKELRVITLHQLGLVHTLIDNDNLG